MLDGLKSQQRDRKRKVRLDRKHLESRARRFLTNYLAAKRESLISIVRSNLPRKNAIRRTWVLALSSWKMLKSPTLLPTLR